MCSVNWLSFVLTSFPVCSSCRLLKHQGFSEQELHAFQGWREGNTVFLCIENLMMLIRLRCSEERHINKEKYHWYCFRYSGSRKYSFSICHDPALFQNTFNLFFTSKFYTWHTMIANWKTFAIYIYMFFSLLSCVHGLNAYSSSFSLKLLLTSSVR